FLNVLSEKFQSQKSEKADSPLIQLDDPPLFVTRPVEFTESERTRIVHLNAFNQYFNPKFSPQRNMVVFRKERPEVFSISTTFFGDKKYQATVGVFDTVFCATEYRRDLAVTQAMSQSFK